MVFLETLTSKYAECDGMDEVVLGRTLLDNLRENIKAGICLICIEDVAKNEAVSFLRRILIFYGNLKVFFDFF